ncbi:polysaccharide pyruvyl transferase family protein [Mangrovimicrobium sediminis]|uniref:Polysaccharide pyruvyl transferase family protein n=1 Tax=Mangrovimicrobium sediminis TaxID=2562682 RepID=A0A4Z0LXC8_9GAMM|nr:polysaccharide pyruvyl transferase family protein [Haliea sp. SAOS-164]TGD71884.1 polysaccharide pyruvyl transferase family protein [Haliea sp. SAOS-164]
MQSDSPKRILIRTLPLANANYGGLLQAYALQSVLHDLGYLPSTDTGVLQYSYWTFARIKQEIKNTLVNHTPLGVLNYLPVSKWTLREAMRRESSRKMMEFVDNHISTVMLFRQSGKFVPEVLDGFDGLLAGSDQVWRRAYSDITSYLFDFAAGSKHIKASYAASFGMDDIDEYGPELKNRSAVLAKALDAVSVREAAGVEICSQCWGVEALQHVDPTLLLSRSHYDRLAGSANFRKSGPYLLSYILDDESKPREVEQRLGAALSLPVERLMHNSPKEYREYRGNRGRYARPTVYEWLAAFRDAEFVVTDSFHGTVFAILNNKPFISLGNQFRGISRFDSLLSLLLLRDRLVLEDISRIEEIASSPIDWTQVTSILEQERSRSRKYLLKVFETRGEVA